MLADVGEFDGAEAARLLAETDGQKTIAAMLGLGDKGASTVLERIASAAPDARGALVRQLHAMNRLDSLCGNLPWKAVEQLR